MPTRRTVNEDGPRINWNTMLLLIDIVLLAGGALLFVLVAFLAMQVVAAVTSSRATSTDDESEPRITVLVPAHNESVGMIPTLDCIRAQLGPADRCVVVADNCSDDTATVAAAAGVTVLERFDETRRGKGYALDFGVRSLVSDPPDVVIVVDADCELPAGSLKRIAGIGHARQRPVQAMYLQRSPRAAESMALIAEFAARVKNCARPLGSGRVGLPCPLMGTGMALPWPILGAIELASGHIVEDAMMGIDFTRAGHPPLYCREASVISVMPASDEGTQSQRTRWEHGNLSMIVGVLPGLLLQGIRRGSWKQIGLAIDLLIPPLALLVLLVGTWFVATAVAAWLGAGLAPLVLMSLVLLLLGIAVGVSWFRYGRDIVPLRTLALTPLYVLRKVPLYLKFLTGRQTEWVRSKRDAT